MGRRLRTFVHVHAANGDTRVFGPDDEVPAEWAKLIGDHVWVTDSSGEQPAVSAPVAPGGPAVVGGVKVPPRGGPGSGRDVWVAYAEANGVEVTDDLRSRDDIIAAVELAGVPAE